MDEPKEYLTKEKFKELSIELENLKKNKRREIAENLESAKSLGDLSENAEYHEARDMQAATEDRISKLESVLKHASIVSGHHTDIVGIGSVVSIKKDDGKENTYTLVGSEESNVKENKISIHAPLGEILLGKKSGDGFEFSAPNGMIKGKIVGIK